MQRAPNFRPDRLLRLDVDFAQNTALNHPHDHDGLRDDHVGQAASLRPPALIVCLRALPTLLPCPDLPYISYALESCLPSAILDAASTGHPSAGFRMQSADQRDVQTVGIVIDADIVNSCLSALAM